MRSLEAPPKLIGRLIRIVGLEGLVPRDISKRLFAPGGRVTVYQVELSRMNEVALREGVAPRPRAPRPKAAGRDSVAVLVPCFNEEVAIGKVVRDIRRALPDATVYVYDNNSTDDTVRVARASGAIVRTERRQGKGNVVRRMFADIDADAYVLLDGDATYDVDIGVCHDFEAGRGAARHGCRMPRSCRWGCL